MLDSVALELVLRTITVYLWSGVRMFWRGICLPGRCSLTTNVTPRDSKVAITDANRALVGHTRTHIGQDRDAKGTLNDAKRTLIGHKPFFLRQNAELWMSEAI